MLDSIAPNLPSTAVEPLPAKENCHTNCPPTAAVLPSDCLTHSDNDWDSEAVTEIVERMRNVKDADELAAFLDIFKTEKVSLEDALYNLGQFDYDAYKRFNKMMQKNNPYTKTTKTEFQLLVDDSELDLDYSPDYQIKPYSPTQSLKPYSEVKKLYLDIETTGLEPKENRAIAIGLWDGENEPILITNKDENELLNEFVETVKKLNPEVVIGHNIFEFDLPFLITRRSWCGGVEMPFKQERYPSTTGGAWVPPIMERKITSSSMNGKPVVFHPVKWAGVQIIDTMQQAAIYEKSANTLTSFSLKNLAIDLGLRSDRRLELSHQEILQLWESGNVNLILEYLQFDLKDTKLLADFFLPQVYYQSEVVPVSM